MKRAKPAAGEGAGGVGAYRLMVLLDGSEPPIWRRIQVAAQSTLAHLHEVLQVAMGWEDCHLHQFSIGGQRYGVPSPDDWERVRDERGAWLARVLPRKGGSFVYEYDLGDSWRHVITVEEIMREVPLDASPACLAGARACPPEDSGGVWGYSSKLAARANPQDEEDEGAGAWLGDFDPEAFDLAAINVRLALLRQRPAVAARRAR